MKTSPSGFIGALMIAIIGVVAAGVGTGAYFLAHKWQPPTTSDIPKAEVVILDQAQIELPATKEIKIHSSVQVEKPTAENLLVEDVVPKPTAQELAAFEWSCALPGAVCSAQMREGFNTNLAFRTLVLDAISRTKTTLAEKQKSNNQTELDCLSEITPEELYPLSPQEQGRIRESKCGTSTPTSDLNYKLYKQQQYTECLVAGAPDYICEAYKPNFY